ncbi:MAG: succinate dehydrogenase, cytochrome b556 subunit [Pseudomonadota bacterium]
MSTIPSAPAGDGTTAAPVSSARPTSAPPVLSPHLQIWRFTVTMAASITHRATGIALYTGSFLLAAWLVAAAFHAPLYGLLSAILSSPLGIIALAGYSWALFFHMANGIRHLFWDLGFGFELSTAKRTACFAYGFATVLAIVVTLAGLTNGGV